MVSIFKISPLNCADGSVHANLMQSYQIFGTNSERHARNVKSSEESTATPHLTPHRFLIAGNSRDSLQQPADIQKSEQAEQSQAT